MKLFSKLFPIVMFLSLQAHAALELELTQGIEGAIPITVKTFQNEPSLKLALTNIVRADLRNSGRFYVADNNKKSDNIVDGKITMTSPNQFKVDFDIIDSLSSAEGSRTVLLSKTYAFNDKNIRMLGHRIADDIYSKLVGKKGFFNTKIAYVLIRNKSGRANQYHLMIADVDGYNAKPLLTSDEPIMSPRWAPDGQRLAYVSFEKKRASIFVQNIINGHREAVAQFYGINGAPSWSPDGKKLAMVLSKSGYPKIYVLELTTRKLTQLTYGDSIDTEPSWSPDGQTLLFTSNRSGGPQIYQLSANGGEPSRLTFNGTYNTTASYSSDGRSVVMLHKEDGMFVIALQDLDTDHVEILTKHGRDQSPSLAPNDDMILFASRHGIRQVLGMVSVDGRVRLRIPSLEGDVREPAWSPRAI